MELRKWLAFGNLHIPFIGAALILGNAALLGAAPDPWFLVLACCGTLLIYHLDRLILIGPEDRVNDPDRVEWASRHRLFVLESSLVAGGLGTWAFVSLDPGLRLWCLILGGIGLMYGVAVPGTHTRLKEVGWAKTPLILACWVVGSAVLPFIPGLRSGAISVSLLVTLFVYRLLYLAPCVFVADWVDRSGDQTAGVRTLAQTMDFARIRQLVALFVVGSASVLFWMGGFVGPGGPGSFGGIGAWFLLDLLGPLATLAIVWRAREPGPRVVFSLDLVLLAPFFVWLALSFD